MAELSVVGKSVARVDSLEKVTGKAMFSSDFKMSRMLYAKVLRSPYAHARIKSIDISKAESLPGVRSIVTGEDAPPVRIGLITADRFALRKDGIVRTIGEPVAAVAAETEEIAEEALDLIEVDYEELPAVFDPEEAMKENPLAILHPDLATYEVMLSMLKSPQPEPDRPNVCLRFKIRNGDVEKAFQEADLIVEDRYSFPRQQHCQMETCRSDAWLDPDGTLVVRTSTQGIYLVKAMLCRLFNLPSTKVRVLSSYVGGGFGGKDGPTTVEPIVAMLAIKSKRPVRLELTREEQFIDSRQKVGIITYIKDGVKRDGTLVAREMRIICDAGPYSDVAIMVCRNCAFGAVGTYRIPNFKLDTYGVYTNMPIAGAYRGFGTPEVTWAIEQQMDILAGKLGLDAVEIRRKNILREGDKDVCGQVTHAIGVERCMDKVAEWIELGKRPKPEEGPWKRGKGLAIGNKYTTVGTNAVANVRVHPDGTIEVRHGNDELGQGLNTVLAQIAAEAFGVPIERVRVVRGDTATCPHDFAAVSSRSTFHTGNAVLRACQDAKRKVFQIASGLLGVSPSDLEMSNGKICVMGWPGRCITLNDLFSAEGVALQQGEIMGTGYFLGLFIPEDPETGQSEKITMYYGYGAHAVEVAVDVETGEVKVLRIGAAFDMGTPINPKMCEEQMRGGIMQGIGMTLHEEIVADEGKVLNPNFVDYKIPTVSEVPALENVKTMIAAVPHREGPFGAKGLGEGVLVSVPPAISNAVYNAIGVRIKDLPITSEKIRKALKEQKG